MGMRRHLKQARDSRDLVRVVRHKKWDHVEVYVAAVGKQWCVLVTVDDDVGRSRAAAYRRRTGAPVLAV